jgi:hypothetical protein
LGGKRKITPRIDKFFKYGKDAEESSSDDYIPSKSRKRMQKASRKNGNETKKRTIA